MRPDQSEKLKLFGRALELVSRQRVFRSLRPREWITLKMRFGLSGDTVHTLKEIGVYLNVTRQRAFQIQWHGLEKLGYVKRRESAWLPPE